MRSKKLATGNDVIEAAPRFLFVSVVQRDPGQVRPKLNAHLVSLLLTTAKQPLTYIERQSSYLAFPRLRRRLRVFGRR